MLRNKKSIIFTLIIGFVLGGFSAAVALPKIEQVNAQINYGIKMVLDGQPFQPEDSGNVVRPVTYNGKLYLPIRSLCDAIGVAVDWDDETQTIFIGEKTDKIKITTDTVATHTLSSNFTQDSELLDIGQKVYEYGICTFETFTSAAFEHKYCSNSKYQKFGAEICYFTGEKEEIEMDFFAEDRHKRLLKKVILRKGEVSKVEFDIANVDNVIVHFPTIEDDIKIVVGEPYFK